MANERQKRPKKQDILFSALVILLSLMIALNLILSICVLIRNPGRLLNGLSIALMVFTVATAAIFIAAIFVDEPREKLRAASGVDDSVPVDEMSGVQFEEYVAGLLRGANWAEVTLTPATGDHGVDITAVYDGEKYAIQCKRYRSAVNTKAVQEVYAGKGVYDADRAVVITNSGFTQKAGEMAGKLNIELWDMTKLERMLLESRRAS